MASSPERRAARRANRKQLKATNRLIIEAYIALGGTSKRPPIEMATRIVCHAMGRGIAPARKNRHKLYDEIRTFIPLINDEHRAKAKDAVSFVWRRPSRVQGGLEEGIRNFYDSWEWRRLSYDVKIERGRRCECCGATPANGARIVTDHIKPIRFYWELRLERANLQILCDDCNKGKGSRDETDWRGAA